jgi:hypothetical protein
MRGKDVVGKLRKTMERVEELPSQDFDEFREEEEETNCIGEGTD